jgi:hypothetical protein
VLHAVGGHGVQQGKRTADIVLEIAAGFAHGFANRNEGGEVDDGLRPVLADQLGKRGLIAEVQPVEAAGGDIVFEAVGQVVHHRDVIALLQQ